jgi:diadenosine tetraphosphatase ApaH/serine/threonine PP2A family protein phosphatase
MRRCTEGAVVWRAVNSLFEYLPVAALIDSAVLCLHGPNPHPHPNTNPGPNPSPNPSPNPNQTLCLHGGLGLSLHSLDQLKGLPRPAKVSPTPTTPTIPTTPTTPNTPAMPAQVDMRATRGVGRLLNDILWSDPTDSDCLEGVLPNARGPNTVQFGPDRVRAFCDANGLKLVIRAHQCVNDGFEYFAQVRTQVRSSMLYYSADEAPLTVVTCFAQGRLLTLFSAPDYGGKFTNDGAMLVINRDLHGPPPPPPPRARMQCIPTPMQPPCLPPCCPLLNAPTRDAYRPLTALLGATSRHPLARPRGGPLGMG